MAQRMMRFMLAVVVVFACMLPLAIACGPAFPVTTFISDDHPDLPLESYAAGNVGVLVPSYSPSYFVVAYHYFSGRTFDADEQKQLVDMWNSHLYAYLDNPQNASAAESRTVYAAVPGLYESYANCLDDAFQTADKTRADREMQFGANSPAVMSWAAAQDKVFANCDQSDPQNPILPDPADASLPLIIRKDRDYQFAAAYFYARGYAEAKKRFLAIAADSQSPWRAISAMVAARCDIRSAMLDTDDALERKQKLTTAADQLRKVIANPSMIAARSAADHLLGYVAYRLDPPARAIEIANTIEQDAAPEDLRNELDDYNSLMKTRLYGPRADALIEQNDMTDWIRSFQVGGGSDRQDHRVTRWEQTHSLPWLAAALAYAQPGDAKAAELLAAAARVPAVSPAYLTITFHRNRLLAFGGQQAQVQTNIDQILNMPQERVSKSTHNLFLALRMQAARNLDEFLQSAPRQAIGVTTYLDSSDPEICAKLPERLNQFCQQPTDPMFDSDAAVEFTQAMPTRVLVQAATSTRLPPTLRIEVAQAAWVRAILLNQDTDARQLVPTISPLEPEIAPQLKAYDEETSPAARTFAAVFLILHRPEMHPYVNAGAARVTASGEIDNFRDNWWCSPAPRVGNEIGPAGRNGSQDFYEMYDRLGSSLSVLYPSGKPVPPLFMAPGERQAAAAEWSQLTASGSAPTWMGQKVLDWAGSHRDDPRVPEALHLVVTSTRVGCTDTNSGADSKQAFTLLHNRYPKTRWAAETPYWFQ